MRPSPLFLFLSLFLLLYSVGSDSALDPKVACKSYAPSIPLSECHALVEIYNSTDGDNWKDNSGWGGPSINDWKGVHAKDMGSGFRVFSLSLPYNNLSGTLPGDIGRFPDLYYLSMAGNKLKGRIPRSIGHIRSLQAVDLSYNDFSGDVGDSFQGLKRLYELLLQGNELEGEIPSYLLELPGLRDVDLSKNKFTGSLDKNLRLSYSVDGLNLSNNKISGVIPSGIFNGFIRSLNLSHNLFSGAIPTSSISVDDLEHLYLNNNRLSGEIPSFIAKMTNLREFNASHNILSGQINEHTFPYETISEITLNDNYLSGFFPVDSLVGTAIRHVNIKNNLFINDFTNESFHALDYESEIPKGMKNRTSLGYVVDSSSDANYIALPATDEHGGMVVLAPGTDLKSSLVAGCHGELEGNVYVLPVGASGCTVLLKFARCDSNLKSCSINIPAENGIKAVAIENPSPERVLSGIVQLRGWSFDKNYLDYLSYQGSENKPRAMKLYIDNKYELSVASYLERDDVTSAMGLEQGVYSNQRLGWDVLINSATLDNGKHSAKLVSAHGDVLAESAFSVFNPRLRSGDTGFVTGDFPSIWVEDFPFSESRVKLSFNVAEQNFSIVDQEVGGRSTRSLERHFSGNSADLSLIEKRNGYPVVNIEYPSKDFPLAGVVSLRGWNALDQSETGMHDGVSILEIDGNISLQPKADERLDVKKALDVRFSNPGRSVLIYSGMLKNGIHRLRFLVGRVQDEVVFESFSPVNSENKQEYISGVNRSVRYQGFPFEGSEVELSFDQASQSFVISKQWVDGVEVN